MINKEEVKNINELTCIHGIIINYHCFYCWELMKKLNLDPVNKRIIQEG